MPESHMLALAARLLSLAVLLRMVPEMTLEEFILVTETLKLVDTRPFASLSKDAELIDRIRYGSIVVLLQYLIKKRTMIHLGDVFDLAHSDNRTGMQLVCRLKSDLFDPYIEVLILDLEPIVASFLTEVKYANDTVFMNECMNLAHQMWPLIKNFYAELDGIEAPSTYVAVSLRPARLDVCKMLEQLYKNITDSECVREMKDDRCRFFEQLLQILTIVDAASVSGVL